MCNEPAFRSLQLLDTVLVEDHCGQDAALPGPVCSEPDPPQGRDQLILKVT